MTTIVTPGESLADQIERERDWMCPKCGCVFRPGPDDVRESMGKTMAYGSRLAIEWFAFCPNPDCRSAVTSRWRTAFLEYGPDWAARAYTPAPRKGDDLLADMLAMKAKLDAAAQPRIYGVRCHPADVAAIRQAALPATGDPVYAAWFGGLPCLTSTQARRGWPQVAYTAEVWRRWQEEAQS